jgi:hypothetical protein
METREELMNTENARKARPRSFFTRKLESKLEEKEDRIPQTFLSLLDLPFDDFTPEDHELYEKQLKPLFRDLSAVLLEIFDQIGRPEEGWEARAMPRTPWMITCRPARPSHHRRPRHPNPPRWNVS